MARLFNDTASQASLSTNPRLELRLVPVPAFSPTENAFLEFPERQEKVDVFFGDCGAQVTQIAGTGNCFWWALERALCSDPTVGTSMGTKNAYGSFDEEKMPDCPIHKWKDMIKAYYDKFKSRDIPENIRKTLDTDWMDNPHKISDRDYLCKEWAWCVARVIGRPIWVVFEDPYYGVVNLQVFDPENVQFYFADASIDGFLEEKRNIILEKYPIFVPDVGESTVEPIVLTLFNKHFDLITDYKRYPDFKQLLEGLNLLFESGEEKIYSPKGIN